MNNEEYLESIFDASDNIRNVLATLRPCEAFSVMATAIDEYAAFHDLDTMEMWETLHTLAKEVYKEKGAANYVKGWKNEEV